MGEYLGLYNAYSGYAVTNDTTQLWDYNWPVMFWAALAPGSENYWYDGAPDGSWVLGPPVMPWEHVAVGWQSNRVTATPELYGPETVTITSDSQQQTDTTLRYYTGGKSLPGPTPLVVFQPSAWELDGAMTPISPQRISVGGFGVAGANGYLVPNIPNGTTNAATVRVAGSANCD